MGFLGSFYKKMLQLNSSFLVIEPRNFFDFKEAMDLYVCCKEIE